MDLSEDSDCPQLADLQEDVIDYLLKPSAKERIRAVSNIPFRRPLETLLSMSRKIAIKTKRRILFIDPAEIAVVEAEGDYVLLRRN